MFKRKTPGDAQNLKFRLSFRSKCEKLFRRREASQKEAANDVQTGRNSASKPCKTRTGEAVLNYHSGLSQHPIQPTERPTAQITGSAKHNNAAEDINEQSEFSVSQEQTAREQSPDPGIDDLSATLATRPGDVSKAPNIKFTFLGDSLNQEPPTQSDNRRALVRTSVCSSHSSTTDYIHRHSICSTSSSLRRISSIKLGREARELRLDALESENAQLRSYIPSLAKQIATAQARDDINRSAFDVQLSASLMREEELENALMKANAGRIAQGKRLKEVMERERAFGVEAEKKLGEANARGRFLCEALEKQVVAAAEREAEFRFAMKEKAIAHEAKEEDLKSSLAFQRQVADELEMEVKEWKSTASKLREMLKEDVMVATAKAEEMASLLEQKETEAEDMQKQFAAQLERQAIGSRMTLEKQVAAANAVVDKLKSEHQAQLASIKKSKTDMLHAFNTDKYRFKALIEALNHRIVRNKKEAAHRDRQTKVMWNVLHQIKHENDQIIQDLQADVQSRIEEIQHLKRENTRLMHSLQLLGRQADADVQAAKIETDAAKKALGQKFEPLEQQIRELKAENHDWRNSSTYRGRLKFKRVLGKRNRDSVQTV